MGAEGSGGEIKPVHDVIELNHELLDNNHLRLVVLKQHLAFFHKCLHILLHGLKVIERLQSSEKELFQIKADFFFLFFHEPGFPLASLK